MTASASSISLAVDELRSIVGVEHVRNAAPSDAVDGVQPQFVVEPADEDQVARVLKCANAAGLGVIPRGGGTKLGWGNRPQHADLILSTARLSKVIEHAASDMTATVQAGCTIAELQRTLALERQRLACDPLWPERATVGGILSTNDSGTLRVRFGALRDLIIGVTLALPDGTVAKSGGKVVKNVAGYDLPKLVTGALGTLAVITQAVFRLYPLSGVTRSLTMAFPSAAEANKFMLAAQDSKLAFTGLQLRTARGQAPEVDIRFNGTEAGVSAQCEQSAKMAGAATVADAAATVWNARQELFRPGVVAKVSTLPATIASLCDTVNRQAGSNDWAFAMQATGLGTLWMSGESAGLQSRVSELRAALEPAGSLVVLQCPTEWKGSFDVWGKPTDALDLMRRIKRQFDASRTLNAGRFIGGI